MPGKTFFNRIQRAGANIAINHADSTQGERGKGLFRYAGLHKVESCLIGKGGLSQFCRWRMLALDDVPLKQVCVLQHEMLYGAPTSARCNLYKYRQAAARSVEFAKLIEFRYRHVLTGI